MLRVPLPRDQDAPHNLRVCSELEVFYRVIIISPKQSVKHVEVDPDQTLHYSLIVDNIIEI